jgi:hypothetical protein
MSVDFCDYTLNPQQRFARDDCVYVKASFTGEEYQYELLKELSGDRESEE